MTRRRQAGYSLVVVLWVVTLLTVLTMQYQASSRTESLQIALTLRRTEARAAAESGIWLALKSAVESADGPPSGRAPATYSFTLSEIPVSIEIADVAGLINLNRAPADLLVVPFAHSDLEPSARTDVLGAILDWRDVDQETRNGSSELAAYETPWGRVPVRNGFFSTVDELRAIPGITDVVYQQVRGLLTVYGAHGRLNLDAAPKEVLLAMPGATEDAVEALLEGRTGNDPRAARSLQGVNRRLLQNAGGDIYKVTAKAAISGVTVTLSPIVRIPRRRGEAITILAWGGDAA